MIRDYRLARLHCFTEGGARFEAMVNPSHPRGSIATLPEGAQHQLQRVAPGLVRYICIYIFSTACTQTLISLAAYRNLTGYNASHPRGSIAILPEGAQHQLQRVAPWLVRYSVFNSLYSNLTMSRPLTMRPWLTPKPPIWEASRFSRKAHSINYEWSRQGWCAKLKKTQFHSLYS